MGPNVPSHQLLGCSLDTSWTQRKESNSSWWSTACFAFRWGFLKDGGWKGSCLLFSLSLPEEDPGFHWVERLEANDCHMPLSRCIFRWVPVYPNKQNSVKALWLGRISIYACRIAQKCSRTSFYPDYPCIWINRDPLVCWLQWFLISASKEGRTSIHYWLFTILFLLSLPQTNRVIARFTRNPSCPQHFLWWVDSVFVDGSKHWCVPWAQHSEITSWDSI